MILARRDPAVTGVSLLVAAVTMAFAAFTSAMVVRRGLSNDWLRTPLPAIVWLNALQLAASSAAVWRVSNRNRLPLLLGAMFLAGQIETWRELSAAGYYLSTNPSSAFFYVLSAFHAVHVAGGLFALRFAHRRAAGIYWHGMTGLWLYVLLLFTVWG